MKNVMQVFSSWGIATKLVVLFVVFGVVPMAAVGLIAVQASEDIKQSVGHRFEASANSLADKIDRNLFERYGDVQAFGYNDAAHRISQWYDPSQYNSISKVMNRYVKSYGIYELSMMVDTRGDVVAVNYLDRNGDPIDSKFLFSENFADAPWFKALEAGEFTTKRQFTSAGNDISTGTYIEGAHVDPVVAKATGGDGYVVGFSAPVYNDIGEVVAYWTNRATMSIVEELFAQTYQDLKNMGFPGAELTLIDDQGRVLVDYDPISVGSENVSRNFNVLMKLNLVEKGVEAAKAAVSGKSGSNTSMHARKKIMQVGGYAHLRGALGFPGMDWAVMVRVPESEAVAQADAIQGKVLFAALICIGLMIPIGLFVGRRGATQVSNVQRAAEEMAAGKYETRVKVTSNDEIGQLGGAFNSMAEKIQQNASEAKEFEGKMNAVSKAQAVIEFNLDGTIIKANDNFLTTLGYTHDEVVGKHHRMFVESSYANSPEYQALWAKLNRGEYDAGVYKRIGKNGEEVWIQASYNPIFDVNGKPYKAVKFATDITQQKTISADFEGKMDAVSKAQAVIEFNMDGTILIANDNFLNTVGYSMQEIKGKHHRMFVEPALANSSEYQGFWAKLNRGEYDAGVYKRVGKGGKEIWIQASYNPIFDPNGKPYKVVKFATDITGQQKALNEVEHLIDAAARGELNERIDTSQFEGSSKALTKGFNSLLDAVVKPLNEAQSVIGALAQGDLTKQVNGEYQGEFDRIKNSLNTAIENLVSTVQTVREGADSVSTGSAEITSGNEDLSQRTAEQAGALEETSASMEEMTSTIKQNADNAKQANQLAVAAREVAEKGGSVTERAVEAMSEINKSSKKIADIINVIDEIAFQTNLLALNAAVEAARAGEQGRGFAVVASEVRNLAGRSATAAKEIKTLINESVQKVSDGSDLVNQSGQTLEEIVTSVKRVTDIISEISAASQEQAAGIDQVNKAVIQMDQSTQQNAALVEETTSASQSMRQQAAELLSQVDFFKTAQTGATSSAGKAEKKVSAPSPSPQVSRVSESEPVGVGASNGHDRRQRDDDFFEEF